MPRNLSALILFALGCFACTSGSESGHGGLEVDRDQLGEEDSVAIEDTSAFFRTVKGFMEEHPIEEEGEYYLVMFYEKVDEARFEISKLSTAPMMRRLRPDQDFRDVTDLDTFTAKEVHEHTHDGLEPPYDFFLADSVTKLFGSMVVFAPLSGDSLGKNFFEGMRFKPLIIEEFPTQRGESVGFPREEYRLKEISGKPEKYEVTFHSDEGKVTETVEIKDTALKEELHRMLKGRDPREGTDAHKKDTLFNSEGDPVLVRLEDDLFGASVKKYEYDDAGRVMRITGYDQNERIKPFHKGIAIRVHEYDKKGRLVEIRNYGEDRNLISSEYEDSPIIRRKYNEQGQLIQKRFYNKEGDLRSDFAISKYTYDEKGERVHKGLFKKNGEPYR